MGKSAKQGRKKQGKQQRTGESRGRFKAVTPSAMELGEDLHEQLSSKDEGDRAHKQLGDKGKDVHKQPNDKDEDAHKQSNDENEDEHKQPNNEDEDAHEKPSDEDEDTHEQSGNEDKDGRVSDLSERESPAAHMVPAPHGGHTRQGRSGTVFVLVNTPTQRKTSTRVDAEETSAIPIPDVDDLPAYMQDALAYFRDDISTDPRWEALIIAWVKFEAVLGFKARNARVCTGSFR